MLKSQRSIGVVLSYFHFALNIVVNFLYVPFLISSLGDDEYGLYQLMGSLIAYFSVFDFGISNSTVRFYSLYKTNNDETGKSSVLSTSMMMFSLISLVVLLLGGVLFFSIDPIFGNTLSTGQISEAKTIFLIQLFNVVVSLLGKTFNAVITAEEKFLFHKLSLIVQASLQPIAMFSIVSQAPYALTVVIIQTVFNVLINFTHLIYVFIKIPPKFSFRRFDHQLIKSFLKLSLSIFIVAITDQVFWKTNQFILGARVGTSAVTVYAVAAQIYMNYMVISSTIQGVFLPKVTALVTQNKNREVNSLFINIGKVQFLILGLVLIGFTCVGKDFINLWVGADFLDAYWIALITMFAMTIDLIQNLGCTVLQSMNRYGIRALVLITAAIVNVVFVVVFADFGGIACASVSAICIVVANGPVMNFFYKRIACLNVLSFWKEIFKIFVKLLIILVAAMVVSHINIPFGHIISFIVKIVIIVLIYLLVLFKDIINLKNSLKSND